MVATLTLEQAKKLMKSYADRNEYYADLWEEIKYARTIDRLVLILQMHVAGGLETAPRASFFLDEINLVPLYKRLSFGSTVYFQKLGYRPGWQFGKIFTPTVDVEYDDQGYVRNMSPRIADLSEHVARVLDLPYRLVKINQDTQHWVVFWKSSLGENGTYHTLAEHLFDDANALYCQYL